MGAGYKPTAVPIIDYNYKVPFKELFTALEYRQESYDENVKELDALEESWLTLSSIPGEEDLAAKKKAEYDSYVDQITKQVGGDFSKADSLVRNISRTLKKDMAGGLFGRISTNAATYKAMKEANDKRVKSGKKGQRITQKQADAALMIQMNKFYSAGGSEGGATFNAYNPVPYFDLHKAAQDFVKEWEPDQVVGNIYLEQAENGEAIFRRVDTKEMASEDEILNAVMGMLESNDMASQYVGEGVAFDMYGITEEDLATEQGQEKVKQARENLKNFYDDEDILAMSDKQAVVAAMTKNTYANAALPYVAQAGYEKISSKVSNLPESWYKFGNNIDEMYVNTVLTKSFTSMLESPIAGHTFENTDQLEDFGEGLDNEIIKLDIQIKRYGEELIADPGNESIAAEIGKLKARKGLIELSKKEFESKYGPVYQDIEDAKAKFIETNGNSSVYANSETPTQKEYIDALTEFKRMNGYNTDSEMWSGYAESIREDYPKLYKRLTNDGEKAGDGSYIKEVGSSLHRDLFPTLNGAWVRSQNEFFDAGGYNSENFANIFSQSAGPLSNVRGGSSHINNLVKVNDSQKRYIKEQTDIDLKSLQLDTPKEYAATNFGISSEEGNEGKQSALSSIITSSYQIDPENFVVYDAGENKVLDAPDNPADLVITGILNDVGGKDGFWLKGYMPKRDDDDNIEYNDKGMPLFGKTYLIGMNPYIGGNSSLMRILADGLSRTGSPEGEEMSNRLFGHSFRQSLSWFDYHKPDPNGSTQSVIANIDADDYVRVDRKLNVQEIDNPDFNPDLPVGQNNLEKLPPGAPEFRLYHHGGSDDGDVIKDSNGSDMIFYNLDDATNMYEEIHKAATGTQDFNPYTNEYPSWVTSVGKGGVFTNDPAADTYKIEAKSSASRLGLVNAFGSDRLNMQIDKQAYAPYISKDMETVIDASGLKSKLSGQKLTGAYRTGLYNHYLGDVTEGVAENSKHVDGRAMDIQYNTELETYLNNNKTKLEGEGISFLVHGEGAQKHIHIQYNK